MKKIQDILENRHLDEGILYEAGINRVMSHASKGPFAVITAFRGNFSLKQNRDRNKQLESEFRKIKSGGIKLIGHWEEAPDGMSWEEAKKSGRTDDIVEESYFIPMPQSMDFEEFKDAIHGMVRKFNQDAAVIGDGSKIYLLFQNGSLDSIGSSVTAGKISQAYSKIRRGGGKKIPFVFEGTIQPSNNIHRMALQRRGVKWFSDVS